MLSLGLDSGSAMTKAVLYDGNKLRSMRMEPTSDRPGEVLRTLYQELYTGEVQKTVTTGYGRKLLPESDKVITEITCHGAGAAFLVPGCRAVIDIGGQDSKVLLLDENGKVTDFLMNDKCAAGTGRFIEMVLARTGQGIEEMDEVLKDHQPEKINSMCAVFAESEIVGLLAREKDPGDILLGCLHAICRRTAVFAQKLISPGEKVFFSGGLARSQLIREILEIYMKPTQIVTHEYAQYTGAIGAAILGYQMKIQ